MNYINYTAFSQVDTWYQQTEKYGFAYQISRKMLLGIITVVCVITPFTNWIIPIAVKTIKKGITVRWS